MPWQIKIFGLLRAVTPVILFSIIIAGIVFSASYIRHHSNRATTSRSLSLPITLWAWERDEDLSFLKGQNTEVGYYAGTFFLNQNGAYFRPRLNKLILPPGIESYPVFRFDYRGKNLNGDDANSAETNGTGKSIEERSEQIVDEIIRFQSLHQARKIQLDFDAVEQDRPLYLDILRRLRARLLPKTSISITALASWLLDDRWVAKADTDEAVAMLFSMGPSTRQILGLVKQDRLRAPSGMKLSVGLSVNELLTNQRIKRSHILEHAERLYIFSSLPWTNTRYQAFLTHMGVR